ncbi:MAG: hypothetical protein NTY03_02660, partial [Candidatus Bathyarchaeota archaeon]|nr:hypothetical protein [Candidatus Bathyarchaeota archaeon]
MVKTFRSQEKIDYNARLYQVGDEHGIVPLLEEIFNPWPKFDTECSLADHWRWKFLDNPVNKNIFPHAVAEYKGEIIGVSHGMLYHIKLGDGTYLVSKGADVAVKSNYQGIGIFNKINELKQVINSKLETKIYFNLTANPILINKKWSEPGFLFPHPIKNFLKIENVDEFFKHSQKETKPWRRLYLKIGLIGSKMVNRLMNMQQKT